MTADAGAARANGPAAGSELRVEGAVIGYGTAPVINGVSIRARPGQLTVIVGPNGAGKSTLLKGIAGLLKCSAGTVRLGETDITNTPAERMIHRGVAYVPQVANVFPSLTVRENLEMGAYIRRGGIESRIDELTVMFPDLKAALPRPARTLSGGQKVMLALARGLMIAPTLLILDEPMAGLAPRVVEMVWSHVLAVRQTGVAVLVVEQNTRMSLRDADYGYVLTNGTNNLEGPGPELLANDQLVRLYIGGEPAGGSAEGKGGPT